MGSLKLNCEQDRIWSVCVLSNLKNEVWIMQKSSHFKKTDYTLKRHMAFIACLQTSEFFHCQMLKTSTKPT